MNTLEKILEEIRELKCNQDSENQDYKIGYTSALSTAEEIIRSHMEGQEVFEFDFNRVKSFDCQCGRHYANIYNDGWIPVEERLPEVQEGLEDMYCPEFNVTIKGAKEATTLKYSWDGTWFDDDGIVYDVIAWQPLPEAYHPKQAPAAEHIMSRFMKVE